MRPLNLKSAAEQTAAYLREEILRGRWQGKFPGVYPLAEELGVNHKTVGAALAQLEHEGLLERRGAGRNRRIVLPESSQSVRSMRLGLLQHYVAEDQKTDYMIEIQRVMAEAGHVVVPAKKSLLDLKMKLDRVARLVNSMEVDAWIVYVGSYEILEWFAQQSKPTFAVAGRYENVPIAGAKPNMEMAYAEVARRFIELGHRRIVMLCRSVRRLPEPGLSERAFLEVLEVHGIQTSVYNLPNWDDSPDGFQALLASLFQVTPPTALLIDETHLYIAAAQFLSQQGIRVPEDVSLACTINDLSFEWCRPTIANVSWDKKRLVRRVEQWAANISAGKSDLKQTTVSAKFIDGGTVGPVSGVMG